MGKKDSRKRKGKKESTAGRSVDVPSANDHEAVGVHEMAELAVDLWRIDARAKRENAGERVLIACERAFDRLTSMGFRVDEMKSWVYDENLKVRVIEHEDGDEERRIVECITPAVFYKDRLVREAEVITRGR